MNREPQITKQPSADAIRSCVDKIIQPEFADEAVQAFVTVLSSVTSELSETEYELAQVAMRHAFTKTDAFQDAFLKFSGDRPEEYESLKQQPMPLMTM